MIVRSMHDPTKDKRIRFGTAGPRKIRAGQFNAGQYPNALLLVGFTLWPAKSMPWQALR
jgi:hypothetical protein